MAEQRPPDFQGRGETHAALPSAMSAPALETLESARPPTAFSAPCLWCKELLEFGPPWRHVTDGTVVRVRPDGRDDHVATPCLATDQLLASCAEPDCQAAFFTTPGGPDRCVVHR